MSLQQFLWAAPACDLWLRAAAWGWRALGWLLGWRLSPGNSSFKIHGAAGVIWVLAKFQLGYNCVWPPVKASCPSPMTVAVSHPCSYLLCNLAGLLWKNDFVSSHQWLFLVA